MDEKERIERLINSAYSKWLKDGHREGYSEGLLKLKASLDIVQTRLQQEEYSVKELIKKIDEKGDGS